MEKISGKQVNEIINLYCSNNSILETAKAAGVSTVKVRKVLITEGLWQSDTSIKVADLLNQGYSTEEIAQMLHMSIKNVQAYMPYERGLYGGEEQSLEAVRSNKYRRRMKAAAAMQMVNRTQKNLEVEGEKEMQEKKIIGFKDEKKDESLRVLKLHLELDMEYVDEEERQILKKYGSMKDSISRDILVPADITLHALNYAILRMFGWQNGHLHCFSLPEEVFDKLTEKRFVTWAAMAGVYFRFPTEDYDDIYWDDDYVEGQSFKSWMKKKYTGPYKYKGLREHYLNNQMEVNDMFDRWKEITVHEFCFGAEKQPEPYNVKLGEATVEQVIHAFADVSCHELIERLPLAQVLCTPDSKKYDFVQIRKYVEKELVKWDIDDAIEQYEYARFKSAKQRQEFLQQYDIPVLPVTEQLLYSYDYGDGWKVLITCEEAYQTDDVGIWRDSKGEIPVVWKEELEQVITKHRPVCIAKDGMELVDDVGGIGGFCRMLCTIYGCNIYDEEKMEERESMLGWADMMGWTGRRISPKQTL